MNPIDNPNNYVDGIYDPVFPDYGTFNDQLAGLHGDSKPLINQSLIKQVKKFWLTRLLEWAGLVKPNK